MTYYPDIAVLKEMVYIGGGGCFNDMGNVEIRERTVMVLGRLELAPSI